MSTASSGASGNNGTDKSELTRLTKAVHRLLDQWEDFRARAVSAEARAEELERTLRELSTGSVDPLTLARRVQTLEQENRFLARRLDRARESVKRISARLQFLDDDR